MKGSLEIAIEGSPLTKQQNGITASFAEEGKTNCCPIVGCGYGVIGTDDTK